MIELVKPRFVPRGQFFAPIRDVRIRRFADYWLALRAQRAMPRRSELDPTAFPYALSVIMITDVRDDDIVYRLAGEEINRAYGGSIVGKRPADLTDARTARFIRSAVAVIRDQRAARYGIATYVRENGREIIAERLALPLSEDGSLVDHIVTVVVRVGYGAQFDNVDAEEAVNLDQVVYWDCSEAAAGG